MRPIREKLARRFDPKSLPRFPIDAMNRIDGTLNRGGGGGGEGRGGGGGGKGGGGEVGRWEEGREGKKNIHGIAADNNGVKYAVEAFACVFLSDGHACCLLHYTLALRSFTDLRQTAAFLIRSYFPSCIA